MPQRAKVRRSCCLRYGISSVGPRQSACGLPSRNPASNRAGDGFARNRPVGDAAARGFHFDQRLQPEHAARTVANQRDIEPARRGFARDGARHTLGADRESGGVARNVDLSRSSACPPGTIDQKVGDARRHAAIRLAIQHHGRRQRAISEAEYLFDGEAADRAWSHPA